MSEEQKIEVSGAYHRIGESHLVCQDYALNGHGYAIFSDGCSNGGGPNLHTEFGSMILCKAAEEHLDKLPSIVPFTTAVCGTAQTQARSFPNLPDGTITATLGVVYRQPGRTNALLIGDGTIAARYRGTNKWLVIQYDAVKGGEQDKAAPYYLKYDIFRQRRDYYRLFGGKYTRSLYEGDFTLPIPDPPVGETDDELPTELDWNEVQELNLPEMSHPYFMDEFPTTEFDLVVGMSDGASSFYEMVTTETTKHQNFLHTLKVLPTILDFSDTNPGFVINQCQWIFKREFEGCFPKLGWKHSDDFSIGAVYNG